MGKAFIDKMIWQRNLSGICAAGSILLLSINGSSLPAVAQQPSGDSGQTPPTGTVLKGSVVDPEALKPAARLITDPEKEQSLLQPVHVQQFAGSQADRRKRPVQPPPVKGAVDTSQHSGGVKSPPPPPAAWGNTEEHAIREPPPLWGENRSDEQPAVLIKPQAKPGPQAKAKPGVVFIPPLPSVVKTWQPGYSVNVLQGRVQPPAPQRAQFANPLEMFLFHRAMDARAQSSVRPLTAGNTGSVAARATQFALPRYIPPNWDVWYQHVAHAIYQVWQQEPVSPGTTLVRVSIDQGQNVDCRVLNFTPPADISRNGRSESAFREAALKSVNVLDKSDVCTFPAVHPNKVVFDVELTRLVDGPAGCEVVHKHQSESMRAAQK